MLTGKLTGGFFESTELGKKNKEKEINNRKSCSMEEIRCNTISIYFQQNIDGNTHWLHAHQLGI